MGQVAKNPFDLRHRQDTELVEVGDSTQQKASISEENSLPSNPFDIIANPNVIEDNVKQDHTSEENNQEPRNSSFLFWLLLSIVLLFSAVYGMSKDRIGQLYNSFINENFLRQLFRQNQGVFSIVYFVLYLFAFVNLGIFGYHCLSYWEANIPHTLYFLAQLVGVVTLILIGKHLLLSFVGNIFPISKEISLYSFTIMTFWILIGIFLLPINILINYAPLLISKYTLLGAVGVILAVLIYRAFRGISIGSKYLFSHKFHFFIYLCTIEVLPFIILLKFFQNYTEATLL